MTIKCMKRCSMFLAIREMKIKTTVRKHCMSIGMTQIKNSDNSRFWRGCGETVRCIAGGNINCHSYSGKTVWLVIIFK